MGGVNPKNPNITMESLLNWVLGFFGFIGFLLGILKEIVKTVIKVFLGSYDL